jgi:hypothetical protein
MQKQLDIVDITSEIRRPINANIVIINFYYLDHLVNCDTVIFYQPCDDNIWAKNAKLTSQILRELWQNDHIYCNITDSVEIEINANIDENKALKFAKQVFPHAKIFETTC